MSVDPAFLDIFERLVESGATPPAVVASGRETTVAKRRVRAGGNVELILATLQRWPALDDDELAQRAGVRPRQQVNLICRRLEERGVLERFTGPRGKLVNRLTGVHQTEPPAASSQLPRSSMKTALTKVRALSTSAHSSIRLGAAVEDTLIIIPCSGRKSGGSEPAGEGGTLLGELPDVKRVRSVARRRW
jgi:hypothetical protein